MALHIQRRPQAWVRPVAAVLVLAAMTVACSAKTAGSGTKLTAPPPSSAAVNSTPMDQSATPSSSGTPSGASRSATDTTTPKGPTTHRPAPGATPPIARMIEDHSGVVTGDTSSPVTVELYEDMLCPICGAFEQTSGKTLASLISGKKARVVFRPIAILDRSTVPAGYSTRAVNALACMPDTRTFLNLHGLLFARQPAEGSAGLTDARLAALAAQAGARGGAVSGCITRHTWSGWVASNTRRAVDVGVTGTPTILVDGKRTVGANGYPPMPADLLAAVKAAS